MDYKEKLEEAKRLYETATVDQRYVLESLFPELKESKDEKIRKALIENFKFYCCDYLKTSKWGKDDDLLVTDILAWLEKQGEHDVYKESFNDGYKLGYREASENIQEEPEKYGLCKIEKLGEQNPAFSEEDEYVFNKVLNWVLIVNPTSSIFEKLPKEQFIERFKSLRPQINVTDEELIKARNEAYNDALDKLEYHSDTPTFNDGWSAAIWYLKKRNAQPQSQWKPSDEQMEALLYEVNAWDEDSVNGQNLKLLYQDLKRLTE